MALKLTITSMQRGLLGARSSIVFGVGGGSIGRAHDNDWVLTDPNRYLSAHHARVQCRQHSYYLLDTSTNGVYVNEGTVAIGRRNPYPLRDGDRLRLGDYEMAVSIDPTIEAPGASSIFPLPPDQAPVQGIGDIGSSLNVMRDVLQLDTTSPFGRSGPVNAFGQPHTTDAGLLDFDRNGKPSADHVLVPPLARRELRAAERQSVENGGAAEAFCRGAGIDSKQLPADVQGRLMHLAGTLLRESLVGLKGLVLSQREMRDRFGVDVGRENSQHIGLTGLPVEDLLVRLMIGHERRDLDAVQWLRDTLASTRRHEHATIKALYVALAQFIARLDPRQGLDGEIVNDAIAELGMRFRSITEMSPERLPHLFQEAFARAFAADFKPPGSD